MLAIRSPARRSCPTSPTTGGVTSRSANGVSRGGRRSIPGLETIERHGEELRVRVPEEDEPWRQTTVLAQRGETSIEITSDLPLETLLELVDSLVPAPPEPPKLAPPD